jgi:hypothetical protein
MLADGSVGDAANPGVAGVDVYLYANDGVSAPNAADTLVVQPGLANPAVTDANGWYSFDGLAPGEYWVVVDSKTIGGTFEAGFGPTDVWPEQTYGPAGRVQQTAFASWSIYPSAGEMYGGMQDAGGYQRRSDDATDLLTAEHVAKVDTSAGSVTAVDFGFSFNVVTTTAGGDAVDDDPAPKRTIQGSLRQFIANANAVREQLRGEVLPTVVQQHDLSWEFTGRAEDQRETAEDMKRGALFALAMIYIVLAWVFGSYGWPLVVMAIIPFGVVGALYGHFLMGVTPTILSMFGLFALSGIVVNDSIILVVFYKQLREKGVAVREAIVEAACRRLRAVLLTSLTTIAGLLPLLFETSLQAQFLIPMAVSISFGLAFGTFLVLLLVPTLLAGLEGLRLRIGGRLARSAA